MTDYSLFPPGEIDVRDVSPKFKSLESAIWTQRKAYLIQLYLNLFVYVTYRGVYLDAFSGPQKHADAWAARLLWENNPGRNRRRIDRLEFFEKSPRSVAALRGMIRATPADGREVNIYQGDCNEELPKLLKTRPITSPAFCLLDQRSIECSWALVETLAGHKKTGHKVELFYFLMASWKDRSLKNLTKDPVADLERWWGRSDYEVAIKADNTRLAEIFCNRFRNDLNYRYAMAFPIFSNQVGCVGGRLQYWMIHASDHDEAPKFMIRAFNKLACGYNPANKQESFEWSDVELKAQLSGIPGWEDEQRSKK